MSYLVLKFLRGSKDLKMKRERSKIRVPVGLAHQKAGANIEEVDEIV
jgi:hypothetical protein